jgi:hypothetical protein
MFIRNLLDTYERPSTAETLKTIRQKHDESFYDYVKHFCNARNDIPHIQDIEIINVFRDGVSDLKTVEEIAMKKPKTVADLLTIANVCIEASEAQAQLLESRAKGPSRRRDDRKVNTAEREDQKDRGGYHYRRKQSSDQKEKRPFQRPDSVEKRIAPMDMIWKNAKLFCIAKRCRLQQHRHPKILIGRSLTEMSIWRKST